MAARSRSEGTLEATGDPEADRLLNTVPAARLDGVAVDPQGALAWAFVGPGPQEGRLGFLDAGRIAAMDPDELVDVFCAKPALRRYPAVMARRTHELCV